jgi:hypothetical protein
MKHERRALTEYHQPYLGGTVEHYLEGRRYSATDDQT